MLTLSRTLLGIILLAFVLLPGKVNADQPLPLPDCRPYTGGRLYPAPSVRKDNVFFTTAEWAPNDFYIHYLRKSADRGRTWQPLPELAQVVRRGETIFISPNYALDQALAIGSGVTTNLSTDDGVSWRIVTFPRTDSANTFALGDAQHLYVGYGREIGVPVPMALWASNDGGLNWRRTYEGMEVRQIAVSPTSAQDHTLLIAVGLYQYNGGLLKSTDAGITWTRADAGIVRDGESVTSLQFSPAYATDHTLFYATSAVAEIGEVRVYKSTDAGASWRPMTDPLLPSTVAGVFLISPRYQQDQTLWYVSYYNASISRDGGQTWQIVPYPLWLQTAAEYCLPNGRCGVELFGQRLLKSSAPKPDIVSMYHSYDYGQTWRCLDDPGPPPAPPAEIPEPSTLLLLGGGIAALAAHSGALRFRCREIAR